jgi:DNA-binding NarL/FixJ family response regulator
MIRVAVLDDQPAVVAGLTAMLRAEPGLIPVGAASTEAQLWPLLERVRPDVAILDDHLNRTDGLQLCRRVAAAAGSPKVVLYTEREDVAVAARVAGVDAVATRSAPTHELFELLRRVARGERVLPEVRPEDLRDAAGRLEADDLPLLSLLAADTPAGEVCAALRMAPRELAWRRERMLGRLRTDAVAAGMPRSAQRSAPVA